MADYIDREALLTHQYNASHSNWPQLAEMVVGVEDIEDAPAADVSPVVHGRWEYIPQTLNTLSQIRCPFCGWWSLDPSIDDAYNYCPNCGEKMDGGDGDAAD